MRQRVAEGEHAVGDGHQAGLLGRAQRRGVEIKHMSRCQHKTKLVGICRGSDEQQHARRVGHGANLAFIDLLHPFPSPQWRGTIVRAESADGLGGTGQLNDGQRISGRVAEHALDQKRIQVSGLSPE